MTAFVNRSHWIMARKLNNTEYLSDAYIMLMWVYIYMVTVVIYWGRLCFIFMYILELYLGWGDSGYPPGEFPGDIVS